MRATLLVFLLVGCAHAKVSAHEPLIVSVQSRLASDACALRLWSDTEQDARLSNRLLPEQGLVGAKSPFRLHAGERRDFVLGAAAQTHLEVLDCEGQIIARQELETSSGWCLTVIAPAGLYARAP